jgi:hypothetical protein
MSNMIRQRNFKTYYAESGEQFVTDEWLTPGTPARATFDANVPTDAFVHFVERDNEGTLTVGWVFGTPYDADDAMAMVKTYHFIGLDGSVREFVSYPHPDYI